MLYFNHYTCTVILTMTCTTIFIMFCTAIPALQFYQILLYIYCFIHFYCNIVSVLHCDTYNALLGYIYIFIFCNNLYYNNCGILHYYIYTFILIVFFATISVLLYLLLYLLYLYYQICFYTYNYNLYYYTYYYK